MKKLLLVLLLSLTALATNSPCWGFVDGEQDNHPDKVRRVPRLGIEVPNEDRTYLEKRLASLQSLLNELHQIDIPRTQRLIPDVEIYYRAVRDNLDNQEFFSPADVKKARRLVEIGVERGVQLHSGKAPWLEQTGLVVRGYRSSLDDTVQPYGLVIPENYQTNGEKDFRLDVWFHGRGETLSETSFIDQRMNNSGYYQPENTIVLHPYGRYSNAFKFAGEVDVLEALAHAQSEYRVDKNRISVRGFSMGGAACWQFAFLYSDRWFAANPGAGFAETPEFLKSFQKEKLNPYPWEEKLWRWYDADDNAINFFHVPTIAYSGEDDIQKQAADLMENALLKEGIQLTHIVGPKTGHRIHVDSQKEIERRMASIARQGNDSFPQIIHKITHTLKYNRQYWLAITGLTEHWEPGRVRAEIEGNSIVIKSSGITGLRFDIPSGYANFEIGQPVKVIINEQSLDGPVVNSDRSWAFEVHQNGDEWQKGAAKVEGLAKVHGLQGPIDDALMSSFLFVAPTGKPLNQVVGEWANEEMNHAVTHWRQHFRGHVRIKKDVEVTADDIRNRNLILWGDPGSNQLIKNSLGKLPLKWDRQQVSIGDKKYDAFKHVPILVYPNPLNPRKYIVINSSFTFREYAYLNNARQVPMLPDWAIVDVVSKPKLNDSKSRFPGIPVEADFFDERWRVKTGDGR